jgi:hypothetical protein
MRITRLITESVMLAVYGHPLPSNHACREPQPEAHEVFDHWVKYN